MTRVTTTAELSSTLRLSVMRLARRLRQQRADQTLTLTQLAALGTLDRCGPLTPGELAEAEGVQPPSMTRVLASLSELGLVERSEHPSDRRTHLVSVTTAAHGMLVADRRRRDAWLAQRLDDLTPEERETLRAAVPLLDRLVGA